MNLSARTLALALLTSLSVSAKSFAVVPSADSSMHTEGTGAVTVVFESGLGDDRLQPEPRVEGDPLGTLGHGSGRVVAHGRALNHSGVA